MLHGIIVLFGLLMFVLLMCVLQVNNMPMVALVHPVYDCLLRLSQPDALVNEDEVTFLFINLYFFNL